MTELLLSLLVLADLHRHAPHPAVGECKGRSQP